MLGRIKVKSLSVRKLPRPTPFLGSKLINFSGIKQCSFSENLMPPKFFGIWRVENAILYEKGCFFKRITIFRKIIASLVILLKEKRTST